MFWDYFICITILIFSIIHIIWANKAVDLTWAVRHGVDDDARNSLVITIRVTAIVFALICIIWLFSQIN